MKHTLSLFTLLCLAACPAWSNPQPDTHPASAERPNPTAVPWADVRLPLPDLKSLLSASTAEAQANKPVPPPVAAAVLAARLSVTWPDAVPDAAVELDVENFTGTWQAVPLFAGAVVLSAVEPAGTRLVMKDERLCLLLPKESRQTVRLQLVLPPVNGGYQLTVPDGAAPSLQLGGWHAGYQVRVTLAGHESLLREPARLGLSAGSAPLVLHKFSSADVERLNAPPEPSDWTWQHQVVVVPEDGELLCTAVARAAATKGSGMEAVLSLPQEARELQAEGNDLAGAPAIARTGDGRQTITLHWKTRDKLDRQVVFTYSLPIGPLDMDWQLPAPAASDGRPVRSRFHIATRPGYSYLAGGLSAVVLPSSLPGNVAAPLAGRTCQVLEGNDAVRLKIQSQQLAETSETIIHDATWQSRVEPDGAMLHEGTLTIEHRGAATCKLELPEGSRLLTCTVAGRAVKPAQPAAGVVDIPLPPGTESKRTEVALAITARGEPVHPVEGTLPLALPTGKDFIRSLRWAVLLPAGYEAEMHGNLQRAALLANDPRHVLRMTKNLCREERPAITLFYQRANLAN